MSYLPPKLISIRIRGLYLKFVRYIIVGSIITLLLIICAGIYKFNYLSSKPGYSVDGNKCYQINPSIGCNDIYKEEDK